MASIQVIKRSGEIVPLDVGTIQSRLRSLVEMEPKLSISIDQIVIKTVSSLTDIIHTSEIDNISATICAGLIALDPDYNKLAARITMSDLHKNVSGDLVKYANDLLYYQDKDNKIKVLHSKTVLFINKNYKQLQQFINYEYDFKFSYLGMIALIQSYLLSYKFSGQTKKITKERPQQMYLRVAIGIHLNDINDNGECNNDIMKSIHDTYMLLAKGYYTHATPTLFNAGTKTPTLSSCYLLSIDDELENIYDRLKDISKISKFSGGVGIHISTVRGAGATIGSTIGESQGLVPMLRVFNESTRYVSQGGGKRKGSTAVYIEPWHSDIMQVLHSQKQQGQSETLCRDLFVALWVPDLFMERVKKSYESNTPIMWSLMTPDTCPRLNEVYGDEFTELYQKYESEGKYIKQINIKTLWNEILSIQIESGKPYLMYKDHVNRKTNQNNLGTIKSSNLCSEVCIYSDKDNIGVCNLASICLPKFVKEKDGKKLFDFNKLHLIAQKVTENMNRVIDNNLYPLKQAYNSDSKNRPLGIGIQGLSEVFMMIGVSYTSEDARLINKQIMETIYHGCLTASNKLAQIHGTYQTFNTSMTSQGLLQFDLWKVKPSSLWDWGSLRNDIKLTGLYNSLLVALMPTAGTSVISGHTESFEAPQSNIMTRSTLSGRFIVVNEHLVNDLKKLKLWNQSMCNKIISHEGSVQNIKEIPQNIREIYKTIYEYRLSHLIEMDADRSAFVCQSSSSNRYLPRPSIDLLSRCHILSYDLGLKTASYYTRIKPQALGKQLTSNETTSTISTVSSTVDQEEEDGECLMCMA